jgi:hypothetical protein
MNLTHVESAKWWLSSKMTGSPGPYCWCGASKGHSLGNCHLCGQPFNTPGHQLSPFELMHRIYRRRAYKNSAPGQRDLRLAFFGNWRYANWTSNPELFKAAVFEEFEAAYNKLKEVVSEPETC